MKILIIIISLTILYLAFNQRLNTVYYKIRTLKIKDGIRIAVLGDLHCELYGKGQKKLIKALQKANPDVVVFTGDIFDRHFADKGAQILLKAVGRKYKSYFVTGNHEFKRGIFNEIPELMRDCGIEYLNGRADGITVKGNRIIFCGVDDYDSDYFLKKDGFFKDQIAKVANREDDGSFSVLLCHQPQIAEFHKAADVDLVISGHAHGGQWRLPFFQNGLFCPDERFFPKYSAGLINLGGYNLVVTRGLARHAVMVPRIFNRPEITVVDLVSEC